MDELIGPLGPAPSLVGLWDDMPCTRCGQLIRESDIWFMEGDPDEDGPVFHERCVVG